MLGLLLLDEFKVVDYVVVDYVDAETIMLDVARHLAYANVVLPLLRLLVVMLVML